MKKKIALLLLFVLCMFVSACNKYKDIDRVHKDEINNMVYRITRARFDRDMGIVDTYVPDVFISDKMRNTYIKNIVNVAEITKPLNNTIGIQNVEYKDIKEEEKIRIKEDISKDYGILKDKLEDISNEGKIVLDIIYYNDKGKKCILRSENFGFIYNNKWYMLVIKEEMKK